MLIDAYLTNRIEMKTYHPNALWKCNKLTNLKCTHERDDNKMHIFTPIDSELSKVLPSIVLKDFSRYNGAYWDVMYLLAKYRVDLIHNFLLNTINNHPCCTCKKHGLKYIEGNPLPTNHNSEEWYNWLVGYHTSVGKGKEEQAEESMQEINNWRYHVFDKSDYKVYIPL